MPKYIIGVSSMDSGVIISYYFMSNQDREKEMEFLERAIRNIRNHI